MAGSSAWPKSGMTTMAFAPCATAPLMSEIIFCRSPPPAETICVTFEHFAASERAAGDAGERAREIGVDRRDRRDERRGVRMRGAVDERGDVELLDDPAGVHDDDP